jgi:membrane associated rhomboid family serine protease
MELKNSLAGMGYEMEVLNNKVMNGYFDKIELLTPESGTDLQRYVDLTYSNMIGASGALFGVLAGFGVLFPNTQLMLLFPPIPIKAKYLIGAYLLFEIYSSIRVMNDQVAHLAHVGGAIVGIILVFVWRRTDRKNFW